MSVSAPPIKDKIVDKDGNMSISWILFFNELWNGDVGKSWTPTFVSMGATGTPTYSGVFYRISQRLVYFRIIVTPDTDTTATAGVTYCDNLPVELAANGTCIASSGVVGSDGGMCLASTNRIYVPGWSAITVPVTIAGVIEAR